MAEFLFFDELIVFNLLHVPICRDVRMCCCYSPHTMPHSFLQHIFFRPLCHREHQITLLSILAKHFIQISYS